MTLGIQMKNKLQKIVIAGGGTAGWMAAAALSKTFGGLLEITLIESEEIGTIGVGESTIPPLRVFHRVLGISEQDFMRATSATFKLGISFENWGELAAKYIHSFGITGQETWMAGFQNFWLLGREKGLAGEFGDYCLEVLAAREGKFATSPKQDVHYAYHLDSTRYAKFLRAFSMQNGLKRIEGKIVHVSQSRPSGYIESLTLESGEVVDGDLFIDCTGFRGELIEKTLNTGFEDWSHWLPCDSAVVAQTAPVGPPVPYTRAIAHDAGWRWQIPLQHRMGNGLVFSSKYLSDEMAFARFTEDIEGELVNEPRLIRYRTGRRLKTWNRNCVALGLSSGFIEPLESTSIHLFMTGITRLLQLFPFDGISPALVNEYNQQTRREVEKIRDFVMLHYHVTQRNDSSFWRHCQQMDVPESLADKVGLFKESARIFREEGDLFRPDSWAQVMIGQGIVPEGYHHLGEAMSDEQLQQFFTGMNESLKKRVSTLPQHQEFLNQYCRAEAAEQKRL